MPYPTPHITNISLLSEIPLDATYRNSIYFASAADQYTYFSGHIVAGLTWTDCMYHRENSAIRVNAPIESCEPINYVMFQNSAYSSKWFYAFVLEHTYINANCTELKIQLDVLQTWYFDYQLMPGFIERNHVSSDRIGENIVPENFDLGEYITYNGDQLVGGTGDWEVIMWTTFNPTNVGNAAGGDISTGLYSALDRTVIGRVTINDFNNPGWTTDPRTVIQNLVNNHADKVPGCVAITMSPVLAGLNAQHRISFTLRATTIDGYTPKNNKLFTAPYNVIALQSGDNNTRYLSAELFFSNRRWQNGDTVSFEIRSDKAPAETVICVPYGYQARGTYYDIYKTNDYITLTGFPQCAWVSDAFQTYLAQNSSSLALSAGMSAIKILGGAALTGATAGLGAAVGAGLVISGSAEIGNLLTTGASLLDKSKMPQVNHGNITGTGLMSITAKGIVALNQCIRADVAKRIDDYFELYGYAINDVGTPSISARPHWTYVKMRGAFCKPKAGSGCPAGALTQIQNIYNAGVTFWRYGNEVGDYSLNNAV